MTHFRSLGLQNFMSHGLTELDLPVAGVLVVTGDNGAGKSSLLEAASWLGWGKTLRSTPPWHQDTKAEPCTVHGALDDGWRLDRMRTNGKNGVLWSEAAKYENNTKALEVLEQRMGSWELWRRTHVFSSTDALLFSLASDSDRKRLIEGFLGVDCFDTGLKACRADLVAATARNTAAQQAKTALELKLEAEQRRLKESKESLAALVEPGAVQVAPPTKSAAEYDVLIRATKLDLDDARSSLHRIAATGGEYISAAKEIRRLLERLHANACPTCSQEIPASLREKLRADAAAREEQAAAAKATADKGREEFEDAIAELEEELDGLKRKRDEASKAGQAVRAAEEALAQYTRQHTVLEKRMREAEAAIDDLTAAGQANAQELVGSAHEVASLEVVEHVLGMKGVRANILGQALSGIEGVANSKLARMGQGLSLRLRPYGEKADGGVKDCISLEIVGAGDGHGYKANSQGERRRVDLGLLLALGEVAGAATGKPAGTLWFDEAFDGLDEKGLTATAETLRELAAGRAVVVVTHQPRLVRALAGCRRVHVAQGKLEELG